MILNVILENECASRALHVYVLYVLTYLTCLCALVPLRRTSLHFFTCLKYPHFLRAFIFCVPYILFVSSFFVNWYLLTKLAQIDELTYDCSPLLLLNSVIYQRLKSIFTFIKLVSNPAWLFLFWNENINYF